MDLSRLLTETRQLDCRGQSLFFPLGVFFFNFFLVTELVYCQNNTFYTGFFRSQYQHKCKKKKSKLKKMDLATSFRQPLICDKP